MLKSFRKRIGKSIDDIEDERLEARLADLGVARIADAATREPILLAGEVQEVQVVTRAGAASLEVTFSDGSGRAAAVFTGRRRLAGVDCGRRILIEGVARTERNRLVIVNPAYTIVE